MGASARRRAVRGPADGEVSTWTYAAIIVALLVVAAIALLGCADDELRARDGAPELAPATVDFGVVAVGTQSERIFTLRNRGDAPLRIAAIEPEGATPDDLVLPAPPAEALPIGGELDLRLVWTPSRPGRGDGALRIVTDAGTEGTLRLAVQGEARVPSVELSRRLDFGRMVLNTDKVLRITALNPGAVPATLVVEPVRGDGLYFTVGENLEAGRLVLPAGGSGLVEVRFFAGLLGAAAAQARFRVEGGASELTVELTGEGFASDLVVTPGSLDLGPVTPGAVSAARTVTVENGGNAPVRFDALVVRPASFEIVATRVGGQAAPLERLAPGERAEVDVAFRPGGLGDFAGVLELPNDDRVNPRPQVRLTGRGGGADLLATPAALDFGALTPGMALERRVLIANVGTGDGPPLDVDRVELAGDPADVGAFRVRGGGFQLSPGDAPQALTVEFAPFTERTFRARLLVHSNDGDRPVTEVPLAGEGRATPPCAWQAEPPVLRFGTVAVGVASTLVVALRNVGRADCQISQLELAPGAPAAFSLPDGPVELATIAPGERLVVPVRLRPDSAGDLSGNLSFYVSDPAAPSGFVQLVATAAESCLHAIPSALELGTVRVSCPAVTRSVRLWNGCGAPLQISDVRLGEGPSSPGELQAQVTLPIRLAAGATADVSITYDPVDEGYDAAPLLVTVDGRPDPLTVSVHGRGTLSDERTDVWSQATRQAVDVLFVVDNSGSMMEEQQAIGAAFVDFIQYALQQDIDYHLGVTTTGLGASGGGWAACPGGVDGGEAGRLFPVTGERPRWIDRDTPDAATVFAQNVQVGVCHWWEAGLEAAYLALSPPLVDSTDDPFTPAPNDGSLGFYRPDARLSVIFVTDEDDHSDRPPDFYSAFFRELKGPGRADLVQVSGVLGDGCPSSSGAGRRYGEVIAATGGVVESICTSDWGRSLGALAEAVFRYRMRFPLTGLPVGAVRVSVDGRPSGSFTYDAAANEVVFAEADAPPPGARVEITYVPACGT